MPWDRPRPSVGEVIEVFADMEAQLARGADREDRWLPIGRPTSPPYLPAIPAPAHGPSDEDILRSAREILPQLFTLAEKALEQRGLVETVGRWRKGLGTPQPAVTDAELAAAYDAVSAWSRRS